MPTQSSSADRGIATLNARLAALLKAQQQAFLAEMNPSLAQRLDRLARLERLLDPEAER